VDPQESSRYTAITEKVEKQRRVVDKISARIQKLETQALDQDEASGTMGMPSESYQMAVRENRELREKVSHAEKNVGNFIREMNQLLAQHEPPSIVKKKIEEALYARAASGGKPSAAANFKMPGSMRTKGRTRTKASSPDDKAKSHSLKRSVERKPRLQFD
jgi:hypothetical protein